MSTIIDEFWIITLDGIPLFSYSLSIKSDYNMVSSFFSALQSFTIELLKDSKGDYINSIVLGNFAYYFLFREEEQLYFISKSKKHIKTKNLKTHIEKIADMFVKKYLVNLQNFDGEVGTFLDFKEDYIKYYTSKVKR